MTHAVHHLDQPGGITLGELQRSFEAITATALDTCLIATVYYLCQNPRVYDKLKDEVRSAFTSEASIGVEAVGSLMHLLKESL